MGELGKAGTSERRRASVRAPGAAGESGSIVLRTSNRPRPLSPMPERYSQLPGLLAQRERAAFGLLRNGYDRRLSLGMRFQLANVFLRPDTPSSHLLFLCHPAHHNSSRKHLHAFDSTMLSKAEEIFRQNAHVSIDMLSKAWHPRIVSNSREALKRERQT